MPPIGYGNLSCSKIKMIYSLVTLEHTVYLEVITKTVPRNVFIYGRPEYNGKEIKEEAFCGEAMN
jgi:hypothetical protein